MVLKSVTGYPFTFLVANGALRSSKRKKGERVGLSHFFAFHPVLDNVVEHRNENQGDKSGSSESADNDTSHGGLNFYPFAESHSHRNQTENGRQGGHEDGAQPPPSPQLDRLA